MLSIIVLYFHAFDLIDSEAELGSKMKNEPILECTPNMDLDNIITPIRVDVLEKYLKEANDDPVETKFLVEGFRNGFSICYNGPRNIKVRSRNLPLTRCGSEVDLWNKMVKEVNLGRFAGPFKEIQFDNYYQSPVALVWKSNGDTRLIFHLSFPRNKKSSINYNTPRHLCTVKYSDLDKVVRLCMKMGRNCYMAKSDMKSVFRHLPIRKEDWKWFLMMAKDPRTKENWFFIEKCLPFGHSMSCSHFQRVSNAIQAILRHKTGYKANNYLDDFLFVAWMKALCNELVQKFLDICKEINFPVAMEKTHWDTRIIVFLGMLLNTKEQVICVPKWLKSKKMTVLKLQQVTRLLNFLCKAIFPARSYTRHYYAKTKGLKQHHHVRVDNEMKEDTHIWLMFLSEEKSVVNRPFVDFKKKLDAREIQFFIDASGSKTRRGLGCFFNGHWCHAKWDHQFMIKNEPSIEYLALYALATGILLWVHQLKNSRVVVFCDNESVVQMLNKASSSCKNCVVLLRKITRQFKQ